MQQESLSVEELYFSFPVYLPQMSWVVYHYFVSCNMDWLYAFSKFCISKSQAAKHVKG